MEEGEKEEKEKEEGKEEDLNETEVMQEEELKPVVRWQNVLLAIPVALLCMIVKLSEGKQGSGHKGNNVLLNTWGLSWGLSWGF